jgi:hypothetical protein
MNGGPLPKRRIQQWLDFQHGTGPGAARPDTGLRDELQRERYEADMKLIPNGGTGSAAHVSRGVHAFPLSEVDAVLA